jgi:CMP-N,N'-diacetyllegionaminic acid synthase
MIQNKKVLAVVTARAGSKGIPMKNVRPILGKPLFMWSVEAGLRSEYVDEVLLSSNCEKCLEIFMEYLLQREENKKVGDDFIIPNLSFVNRPEKYSTDTSKNEEALIHAVKVLGESYFDIVINLQPTSPCRLDRLLDCCIEEYVRGEYDSLLTATKDTPFLWQKINGEWKYTVDRNNCCNRKMRQEFYDDEFVYHDSGCIYIMDRHVLLDTGCRIGSKPCIYETNGINSLQIDTEFDFKLIENMAKVYNLESLV